MKVSPDRLDRLAGLLHEKVGIHARDESRGALLLALMARLGSNPSGLDVDRYLDALQTDEGELRNLLPLVTVGKTSFFRDERQFAALAHVLPGLLSGARREGRRLSIWSAACATGEEAWSLAMAARDAGAEPAEVDLLASDVNPAAVAFAVNGRYSGNRLEGFGETRRSHFEVEGDAFVPSAALRRMVRFIPHNLMNPHYPGAPGQGWDLVFCRNVLIYFDLPTGQAVLQRIFDVMRPGGWLFLGYSESLFRVFDGFELVEQSGAFVYRKPEPRPIAISLPSHPNAAKPIGISQPSRPNAAKPDVARGATPAIGQGAARAAPADWTPRANDRPAAGPGDHTGFWAGPVHGTSASIRQRFPFATDTPPSSGNVLQSIGQQIDRGDFEGARAALESHLEKQPWDLAARLTVANLYGLMRLFDQALACYETALGIEPLRAESHLFSGIHLLARGDLGGAAQALSRALFLEPELVIAHYFLGRCRERCSDLEGARRAYRSAIRSFKERVETRRFLGHYPDLPEDGGPFARAAESALGAL